MADAAWQCCGGRGTRRSATQRFPSLREDSAAHRSEHAIEVQLPFLQMLPAQANVSSDRGRDTVSSSVLHELGQKLAEVISGQPDKTLIIASSDMNHYESDAITRVKDHKAIDRVLALDARASGMS